MISSSNTRSKELKDHYLVADCTSLDDIDNLPENTAFYLGVDPTAPYLHIGNLVPMLAMIRLANKGLKPIMLFGGSTGGIGDPSGRSTERTLLSHSEIEANIKQQSVKVKEIFSRINLDVVFVDNYDWTKDISYLEFLREVGKFITVNYMTAKDVVATRLEGDGISYTEFSYMLLQAFDYWHLHQHHNCRLQIGGSDQWGNMTAGLELIRKKLFSTNTVSKVAPQALSIPLLLDSEGKKFGKSAGNAIWLDEAGTSSFELHQYLLNSGDADVEKYLKIFSFLPDSEIDGLMKEHLDAPHKRLAQHVLADELTKLIHGTEAVNLANRSSQVLFGASLAELNANQLRSIFKDVPSIKLKKTEVLAKSVVDLLVNSKAVGSKGEARRLIQQGGITLSNSRIESIDQQVVSQHLIEDQIIVIKIGKKRNLLVDLD